MAVSTLADRLEAPFARAIGTAADGASYSLARWLFLRALGLVYLIAFLSLWIQVQGLIGPDGILPAQEFLELVRPQLGPERYYLVPTVLWLGAGSTGLNLVCGLGVLGALLLALDFWPRGCLVGLWVLYLSLVAVGRDFLGFQWDALLLEAGLLSVPLAPGYFRPGRAAVAAPSPLAIFLLWGLLFRLIFESGVGKLTSGDPTWRNLSALDFHFFTQPLPTWTAWYANLLPASMKHLAVLATVLGELAAPPMIFLGRRLRTIGWVGIVGLQLLIAATGNYTFFNPLTIALSLLLLDDRTWGGLLPGSVVRVASPSGVLHRSRAAALAMAGFGVPLLLLQLASLGTTLIPGTYPARPFAQALALMSPFQSLNSYGLFRVMTTERAEIVIEGSDDGVTWKAYEFRYKPGALDRRPGFVEPHQPRLDWQMWFAALDRFDRTPWFQALLVRLLQGSPPVLGLLATNPFPDHPPRRVRAMFYDYRFTDLATRGATGAWWARRLLGPYSPELGLADPAAPGP
ncbi:MAG: lipase maturation factor family protein [Gemmatimonadales bacterium]